MDGQLREAPSFNTISKSIWRGCFSTFFYSEAGSASPSVTSPDANDAIGTRAAASAAFLQGRVLDGRRAATSVCPSVSSASPRLVCGVGGAGIRETHDDAATAAAFVHRPSIRRRLCRVADSPAPAAALVRVDCERSRGQGHGRRRQNRCRERKGKPVRTSNFPASRASRPVSFHGHVNCLSPVHHSKAGSRAPHARRSPGGCQYGPGIRPRQIRSDFRRRFAAFDHGLAGFVEVRRGGSARDSVAIVDVAAIRVDPRVEQRVIRT